MTVAQEREHGAGSGPDVSVGDVSGIFVRGNGNTVRQTTVHVAEGIRPATEEEAAGVHNLGRLEATPFVGRERELELLDGLPPDGSNGTPLTVHGMAGVGKTTLIRRYAWRRLTAGRGPVWWVDAETPDLIEAGLAELTRAVHPHAFASLSQADAAAWALTWLQTRRGWLVVLDNVEDPAHLDDVLGRLLTGQVVITTRRDQAWSGSGFHLHVDVFGRPQSLALLRRVTGLRGHEAALAALAEELGDLPLALQQAGAYLAETRTAPDRYLDDLRSDPAEVLADAAHAAAGQQTIARLWTITLARLRDTSPDAVRLLEILAHCAPEPLPRDVLTAALPSRRGADRALGLLAAYSLVALTPDDVTAHRLLQTVVRGSTPSGEGADEAGLHPAQAAVTLLAAATPSADPGDVVQWPRWQRLEPHVQAVIQYQDIAHPHPGLADLLGRVGSYLNARGRSGSAVELQRKALGIAEAVHGHDDPLTAVHRNNVAATLYDAGRHAEAEPLLRALLDTAVAGYGHRDAEIATWLGNLANVLDGLGRYGEAVEVAQQALEATISAHGADHPDIALRMSSLAGTLHSAGRYGEALTHSQEAVRLSTAILGSEHRDTVQRTANLAALYSSLGHHEEALELELRALTATESALGTDHPDTALRAGNLAMTYVSLGRFPQALPLAEKAVEIIRAAHGNAHPSTATHLGNLALVLTHLGQYEQAEPLEREALEISRTFHGPHHDDTALRLSNLAQTLRRTGRLQESLELQQEAVRTTASAIGESHPHYAVQLNNMASVLGELGRHEEAQLLQERALQVAAAALGPDHPTCADYASNLVFTLHRLGMYQEALPYARQAVKTTETTLGKDHPSLAIQLHNLAQTLLALGRRGEGLSSEERALEIAEAGWGPEHPSTAHIRRKLAAATEGTPTVTGSSKLSGAWPWAG